MLDYSGSGETGNAKLLFAAEGGASNQPATRRRAWTTAAHAEGEAGSQACGSAAKKDLVT